MFTLTQRYWECMLSRVIIIGKAPKELVDMLGYNPVIDLDKDRFANQVKDILEHIEDYQDLVDKNHKNALEKGDWKMRINEIMKIMNEFGYNI